MPSETLSTVFSAKENVSDALDSISEAAATAKQTLESADESLSDLDDSLDNATVSSEGFKNSVDRAEDATEELGDSAVQTAVEVQSLNASFSALQTPEFDDTNFRRIDDMVNRARDSIRELSTADTRELRDEFEQVASKIENISRLDLGKNLQEPLTEAQNDLEGVRDTWDEFDDGIAQGNVYELLNNIRQFEDSVDELSEKNVIDPDVDLDDIGDRLRRQMDEADFDPQVTDQFFNEDKIREQITSVEEELDDFEDQRLISGESVEARNIRNRIEEVRNTLEDDEMEMPARVESLSDDLAQLQAETEAFEQAEEITIETDVESATAIEKFQQLANTARQLDDEISNIEAEIDAASVTDAERRVSSIRNTLDETGHSLDGIRDAFDEFDDLTADVDLDSINEERVEDLRERVDNISDISVEPQEVRRDLQHALRDIEQEVSIDPEVEGIDEARERLRRVTDIIEDDEIDIDVAIDEIEGEFDKISENISDVQREVDEIDPDIDETRDRVEEVEQVDLPVNVDTVEARTQLEAFIQEYESREIDISVNTAEVQANADAIKSALGEQAESEEIEYEASSSMFTNLLGREGVEDQLEDAFSGVESVDEFEESLTQFNAKMGLSESRVEALQRALDGMGNDAIEAAIQQETLEESLFELERQAGVAERNIDEVGQAIGRMSISSSASVAPVLAAASALDQLEEQADEADDAIDLDNIESLGLGLRSASLNIGALNVGLTQMATTIPAIVTLIGSLAVALGGLAAAALLAGGAIAAIFAGGVLYQAENLAATSEDIEGTMEGVSEVMSNVGDLFQRAFEPLQDIGAFGMFRNFVEGAAEALNMMLQAVANMRGEINQLNSAVGDAFWANFEGLVMEMQDTIIAFMPVLISLTEWLMENLPEALDFMQREGMRFMGTLAELSAVLVRFFVVLSEFGVTAFNAVMPVLTAMIGLFDRFINAINALPNSVIQAVASFAAILVVTRGVIGIGRQAIGTFADLGVIFTSVAGKGGILRGAIATLGGAIAQFLGFGQQFAIWLSAGGDAAIANATATGVLTSAYASLRSTVVTVIGTLKAYAAAAWTSYANTLTLSNVMGAARWAALGFVGSVKTAALALWGYVTGIGAAITGTWSYIAALAVNVASLIGFIATALVTEGVLYTLGAAFGAAAAGATLLSFALDLLGIGLIIKAVVLLIAVLGGLAGIIAHSDAIMGALRDTWDAVAGTLITVFNVLMKIGVPVFNLFIETLEFFAAIGLAVIDVLKGIFNTIFGAGAAGNMMSAMFSGLAEMISSLDDMIAGFFEALVKGMEEVNSMINEIPGVDVDTSPFEGAKIETEDAQLDQGPLMGGEGKSDGEMSPDKMEQKNVYNQNDITHNNYDMTMNANAEQQATIKRLVKDAISEASRKERLKQGYSG